MTWFLPKLKAVESFYENIPLELSEPEHSYLRGHEIDGRFLVPAMTYLVGTDYSIS